MLDNTRTKRADETEERLDALRVAERQEIEDIAYHSTRAFLDPGEVRERGFQPCSVGFTWERERETTPADRRDARADVLTGEASTDLAVGQNVWFRLRGTVPESMAGHPVSLRFIARPLGDVREAPLGTTRVEALCFRDGEPRQSFDNGHDSMVLFEEADGGESFDLLVEAGTTTLWGHLDVEEFVLKTAELTAQRPAVADLHRHVSVCNDLAGTYDADSPNRGRLLDALVTASHTFPFEAETEAEYREGAAAALETLRAVESEITSDLTGHQLTAVGHAHLDLAWLWPWSETVRKCGRSFANVLGLMEEYPQFTFTQSQPHLYEWIRNRYPDQFEEIGRRIEEGRWQPEGALWVESDINNAGGEALARQFLLGKRYFREEFDVDPEVAFIPDVFGYSPGFPGIAKAADCPYFLTQKMSWSEINDFPHTTFRWEGIDGSEVLAHFPPADTYNGMVDVEEVTESVYGDAQNAVADDRAYLVGYGDGGGGPTSGMVERSEVIDGIEALPDIEWGSLDALFDRLADDREEYPVWTGELYLEKHRGTLTTQARTKRNNRRGEDALREAELWSALAHALSDAAYPHDTLDRAWRVLLFNQFHDILPGSSVTDVYADADRDYERVFEAASGAREDALSALADRAPESAHVCLTNALSWDRRPTAAIPASEVTTGGEHPVAVPDDRAADDPDGLPVQRGTAGIADGIEEGEDVFLIQGPTVPGLGAASVSIEDADGAPGNPFEVSPERLSNGRVTVTFEDDGTVSVVDEASGRSVLDGPGNRLVRYRDHPREFDAWDVEEDLYAVGEELPAPETTVVETGPVRATVRQTRTFGDSELTQEVSLYRDSPRVEFRTHVDWQETEQLLKAHFPAGVETTSATYDTHFGHHERATHGNTSWDRARYEEPGGRWVDVSEPGYGVALLNDCKNGVNVDGTDISLTLLRAPTMPDPEADRDTHEFTYTLFPHADGPVAAGVPRAAKECHTPATGVPVEEPVALSPIDVESETVVVEAVKRAEDRENELVCRLYEAGGRHATATLDFGFPVAGARETNLIEDHERDLALEDGRLGLEFEPFEIRTVGVRLS